MEPAAAFGSARVGRADFWKIADAAGLDSVPVDEARDFHARLRRQIGDQAAVEHVAADALRLVRDDRLHDARSVFP